MLRFEGDRDFRQAPAELWAKLTDARFLAQCIPDVETVRLVRSGSVEKAGAQGELPAELPGRA